MLNELLKNLESVADEIQGLSGCTRQAFLILVRKGAGGWVRRAFV